MGKSLVASEPPLLEAQLKAALNLIPAHTWYGAPHGALLFLNERGADYLGLPQDHPLRFGIDTGASWDSHISLLHPDDHEEARRVWSACLRTSCSGQVSCRIRSAGGGYRWFLSRVEPVRARDGTLRNWIGVNLDIEEQKQAEFHLAEGQRLAHTGSWAFNAAGFNYWSSELFKIYGLDPSGKPPTVEEYLDLVHPEDRDFMEQGIQKMLADHCAFDFTKRIVRPSGEIRRIRCVGIPITQEGTFQGFLGTGMDVTEQERLTEELRLSEHYLSEGERLAHMGSWAFNPSGLFSHWSRELLRIYGLDPAQGAPNLDEYLALIHPQDREFMRSLIKTMVAEASGCDVTKRIVRPDGEIRYIRCVGAPVVEDGRLQRIVGTAMEITEHELLTQELRRREAYLTEAQRLSHTGSFGWRPDSGEVVWSGETYRIFECDHAVKPTIDLLVQRVHSEDRPDFRKVIESASEGATQFEHSYRLRLADGRVKHVHALAHALQDASGNREFVGAATDVTSIKRAEEKLRTSEAYLAEAQRLSQTGSWAWNPVTGEIRYWSEECYRVLGFDPQGPPPRFEAFFQRLHPDDQASVQEQYEKAIRDKADFEFEYRIIHPNKGLRDIHVVGHAVLDRSGELHEFVGTVIDITERKRAEQELQQLVDLVPQLIVVLGPDGKWIYANRMAREYSGLTLEECRSKDLLYRTIHPADLEKVLAARERGLAGGGPFELDARQLGKDGIYRWFLWRYNPSVEEGRVRRWYVSATEIESRKQEEERVRQENVRLEERTRIARELHDTLLQTFLSASMQLGVALDGIAPDSLVKPPLDRILQLMNQGIEEGRNTIQGLRSSDSRTSDLVLALSSVQQELAVQPDIDFRVTVAGRHQALRPPIRNEIYRIGREALLNAFCHSGAKSVELELEYTEDDLHMRVRDNGCGIDPEMLQTGREGHWGLAGMRERATRLSGLLKISSSAAAGTEVELSVPGASAFQVSFKRSA